MNVARGSFIIDVPDNSSAKEIIRDLRQHLPRDDITIMHIGQKLIVWHVKSYRNALKSFATRAGLRCIEGTM